MEQSNPAENPGSRQVGIRTITRRDFLRFALGATGLTVLSTVLPSCVPAPRSAVTTTGDFIPTPTANLPLERKVRQFEFLILTADYNAVSYEMGNMAAENYRKIGLDVKATIMEFNRLSELFSLQHNFDVATMIRSGRPDAIDPDRFCLMLHKSAAVPGMDNVGGYLSPEYDQYFELQRGATDPEKRREAVWKCQEIFGREQPYLVVLARNSVVGFNSRDFSGWSEFMGEGVNLLWSLPALEPKGSRKDLRWGIASDINTLNPFATTNVADFNVLRLIYDRLVIINSKGVPEPWAAESVAYEDPLTCLIKLRAGMTWQDGKPVTSEDAKFSLEYPAQIKAAYFVPLLEPVSSIDIVDGLTIRIKFKRAYVPFLANALGQVFLIPKHIWQDIPEKAGLAKVQDFTNAKPVGSGMYKLEYYRRAEELKLVRYDQHYKKPKIESVLRIAYANGQGVHDGLEIGECDLGGVNIAKLDSAKAKPHLTILEGRTHGFYQIAYQVRRKPFDDVAVRRAMSYCAPKALMVDRLIEGHGDVLNSFITPANQFWHNPNVEKFDLDLNKARKTLAEAGYAWDDKGALYYPPGKTDK